MARVAFIGLGNMGYPMAGHLARAGHEVTVFNRTREKATRWVGEHGGRAAARPRDAAEGAELVFVCVGGDDDVRAVTLGDDGALGAMAVGSTLVDHTTASAELARELHAACATRGVGFVDAPVSGGQSGAQNGQLSVMCGGDDDVVERMRPVVAAYAKSVTHIGGAGTGQLTKMVNQILCAAAIQGAAEALAFGMKAGLDMARVLDAVTAGAASSWYLENRGHTMLRDEFDFGFAVDWMRKDLRLCLEEAARLHADVPLTEQAERYYAELQRRGEGRLDASAVIRVYTHAGTAATDGAKG
ncbi:MAG TPA: NAD(P)-dependent oxidoreductase [Acidimicrobiales bacterium]